MIVAAVLYDETAQYQLTHGLFDGVALDDRVGIQHAALVAFDESLNQTDSECRWTSAQQHKLRGFIDLVEALNP